MSLLLNFVFSANVSLRVTIAMQAALETVNINDDLEVDTLQKHFSHLEQGFEQHCHNMQPLLRTAGFRGFLENSRHAR